MDGRRIFVGGVKWRANRNRDGQRARRFPCRRSLRRVSAAGGGELRRADLGAHGNHHGPVQRIFYFHVSSAWTGFVSFIMVFIGSVAYLRTRALKWDWLSVASAEVGVAFFTIVLVTGPIWAKPVWGIWWTWDARLTSSFLLWVLFVSYLVLRTLVDEPERRAMVSAVSEFSRRWIFRSCIFRSGGFARSIRSR